MKKFTVYYTRHFSDEVCTATCEGMDAESVKKDWKERLWAYFSVIKVEEVK